MDIALFVDRRKELGLSQAELAEGICTQATLSRFENLGQIPSIKILVRLCNRLSIPLGSLFPTVEPKYSEIEKNLTRAEFSFVISDYAQASAILDEINEENLPNLRLQQRFIYLKGFLATLQKASLSDSFFYLNRLITDLKHPNDPIFERLAYVGLGLAYANASEYTRAEYYFEHAQENIYSLEIDDMEDVWRVLCILYHTANFYAMSQDFETSDALLHYAVSICQDNGVTYYVARIKFRLAQNAEAQHVATEEIIELSNDAMAFARINRNEKLVQRILLFQQNLK